MSYSVEAMLNRIRTINNFGFTDNEAFLMMNRAVQLFSVSNDFNLGPTIYYFLYEVGFSFQSLSSSPSILSLSLSERIIPRHKAIIKKCIDPISMKIKDFLIKDS